jgi:hypothetical protein
MRKLTVLLLTLVAQPLAFGARQAGKLDSKFAAKISRSSPIPTRKMGAASPTSSSACVPIFMWRFPSCSIDNGSPIIVLAIKDEKDFRTLEPQAYLAKGSAQIRWAFSARARQKLRSHARGRRGRSSLCSHLPRVHPLPSQQSCRVDAPVAERRASPSFMRTLTFTRRTSRWASPVRRNLELLRAKTNCCR